ncbi:acetamidase/formamidase family protein [Muriicola marianensis]|uniref:Acetamidase n=1 Tax=Muriicola marianensis TaxID=1324801 RepID=A0ABQ1R095_9FLAO|nr:acetamidase/formamidase family protein [Muriicola marianensis]GGD53475.1 acetamidase [Muriicola marianensis]
MKRLFLLSCFLLSLGCREAPVEEPVTVVVEDPTPQYTLTADKNHNKFSSAIPPQLTVPDGSIVEVYTQEATGGQLNINSTLEDFHKVDMDKIHTLTGPIYVEGASPGDVLSVEILDLEPGDWGWTGMGPDFGFLAGDSEAEGFKTFPLDKENNIVRFSENIVIPLKPFLGVIGVAPTTDEMLVTFPPRANGGNMDDPNMTVGVTVYLPVFVDGALLSLGDSHAVQGLGEVVGTAVECDMRAVVRLQVIKDKKIAEPQYETADYYATTGFGTTIDEAAKKATQYMIEHLSKTYGMSEGDAYMLCSLIGDLKIAEVVDMPHMLVTMHIPKSVFKK